MGGTTIITAENLNEIQDAIIALEGAAGDDGTHPAYYIDLAGDYPNYTCPVAMADIKAAYEAGKVLKCRFAMEQYTATLPLSIPMPSANTWIFSGAGALTAMNFPAQSLTIAIDNGAVRASNTRLASMDDIPTIPTALKNPYALTFTGASSKMYDGSSAVTINIPSGSGGGSAITVDSDLSSTSTNPVQNKVIKSALDGKLSTFGGTLTGNLTGKYITGTWLKTTDASERSTTPTKIPVLDSEGWIYYRNLEPLKRDLGVGSGGGGSNLPAVTTSDNGKFLRVVNGAWSAASITSGEGVNF